MTNQAPIKEERVKPSSEMMGTIFFSVLEYKSRVYLLNVRAEFIF